VDIGRASRPVAPIHGNECLYDDETNDAYEVEYEGDDRVVLEETQDAVNHLMDTLQDFKTASERGMHQIHTEPSLADASFRLFCNLRRNFASKEDYKKLLVMATRKTPHPSKYEHQAT